MIDVRSPAEVERACGAFPIVVADAALDTMLACYEEQGCRLVVLDRRDAAWSPVPELVSRLGGPDWMGDSWDALWDVFDEVREEWTEPVVIVVRGVDAALADHPHTTLGTTLFLTQFATEMSREGPVVLPVLTEVGS